MLVLAFLSAPYHGAGGDDAARSAKSVYHPAVFRDYTAKTMEMRIRTEHWVHAHLRQCSIAATPAFVVRRGDNDSGMVLLKINTLGDGCRVLTQTRGPDGQPAWLPAFGGDRAPEEEADAYIARQVARDPDLWVIEIEDPQGRKWFEGDEIT